MLINIAGDTRNHLHAAAIAAVMFAFSPQLMAQGLDAEGAIDAIVGSDVSTGEEAAAADEERIIAAIENSSDSAGKVRRAFAIDRFDIVFLPDLADEDTAIEDKIAEQEEEIALLRTEIQGSAIFYHAIDSRAILLNDVIALEFDDDNGVTIFVAGSEPGTPVE